MRIPSFDGRKAVLSVVFFAAVTMNAVPAGAQASPDRLVVFLASGTQGGDFGGLAGADAFCQQRASDAGLTGTFRAWLSDSSVSAAERFAGTSVTLPYVRTDGTRVAEDYADLTDGAIESIIRPDETGTSARGATRHVWTATNPDGTFDPNFPTCNDWTSSSPDVLGHTGRSRSTNSRWSDHTTEPCDGIADSPDERPVSIYCIQLHPDADDDGVLNDDDCAPDDPERTTTLTFFSDIDGDGLGDGTAPITACAREIPEGFVANADDNCADIANADQTDEDNDGIGDACDPDFGAEAPSDEPDHADDEDPSDASDDPLDLQSAGGGCTASGGQPLVITWLLLLPCALLIRRRTA